MTLTLQNGEQSTEFPFSEKCATHRHGQVEATAGSLYTNPLGISSQTRCQLQISGQDTVAYIVGHLQQ